MELGSDFDSLLAPGLQPNDASLRIINKLVGNFEALKNSLREEERQNQLLRRQMDAAELAHADEVAALRREAQGARRDCDLERTKMASLEQQLANTLTMQQKTHESKMTSLERDFENLQQLLSNTTSQLDRCKGDAMRRVAELERMSALSAAAQAERDKLRSEGSAKDAEMAALQRQLTEVTSALHQERRVRVEQEQINHEVVKMAESMVPPDILQKQRRVESSLREQLRELTAEHERTSKKWATSSQERNAELESKTTSLQKLTAELQSLASAHEELRQQLRVEELEKVQLRAAAERLVQKLQEKGNELEEALHREDEVRARMDVKLTTKSTEANGLAVKLAREMAVNEKIQAENALMLSQVRAADEALHAQTAEARTATAASRSRAEECETRLREQLVTLQQAHDEQAEHNRRLQSEVKTLTLKLSSRGAELTEVLEGKRTEGEEIAKLQRRLCSVTNDCERCEKDIQRVSAAARALEAENARLLQQLDIVSKGAQKDHAQTAELVAKLTVERRDFEVLRSEYNRMKRDFQRELQRDLQRENDANRNWTKVQSQCDCRQPRKHQHKGCERCNPRSTKPRCMKRK